MTTELIQQDNLPQVEHGSVFSSFNAFSSSMKMARALSSSTLVPNEYQGDSNLGNTLIALEVAQRTGSSPLMVMQNLYIVHGRPGWSSQFIIASLNSCGKFSPLRFEISGEGDERSCVAWALEKNTDERLEGPPASIAIAKLEGWYQKKGSKWQTMPELMLRYRAAAFFGRLYAPEILMGMQSAEEISDVQELNRPPSKTSSLSALKEKAKAKNIDPVDFEELEATTEAEPEPEQSEQQNTNSDPIAQPNQETDQPPQYPEAFTDKETKEQGWSDANGEFYDEAKHEWDSSKKQPSVTEAGAFKAKQETA